MGNATVIYGVALSREYKRTWVVGDDILTFQITKNNGTLAHCMTLHIRFCLVLAQKKPMNLVETAGCCDWYVSLGSTSALVRRGTPARRYVQDTGGRTGGWEAKTKAKQGANAMKQKIPIEIGNKKYRLVHLIVLSFDWTDEEEGVRRH